jgi:hypothetical protein
MCGHTHSMPISFYRMDEGGGCGVESNKDKTASAFLLTIATEFINIAIKDMIALFPDVKLK